jgi:hypothetical protein
MAWINGLVFDKYISDSSISFRYKGARSWDARREVRTGYPRLISFIFTTGEML